MGSSESVKVRLQSLITTCQAVTGNMEADLTVQVAALLSIISSGGLITTTATYDETTGELFIARWGGIADVYDEETGELTILHNAAAYNEETGELTI